MRIRLKRGRAFSMPATSPPGWKQSVTAACFQAALRFLKYYFKKLIMRYIPRELEKPLTRAVKNFPAVVLTVPRRAGKTWLLRHLFPEASYFLLEDPDIVARLRADPQGFLDAVTTPAILDEVQHVPRLCAQPD
jgi:predicted AAA+ superfamily ATPase